MGPFDNFLSPEVQSLLGPLAGPQGLVGQQQSRPDNGLLEHIFGQGPGDPRGDAMMALSVGLMRGDFPSGIEAANRTLAAGRDRQERQQFQQLGLLRTGLELDGLLDSRKRQRGIRGDLDKLYGTQPQNGLLAALDAPANGPNAPAGMPTPPEPQPLGMAAIPGAPGLPGLGAPNAIGGLPAMPAPVDGAGAPALSSYRRAELGDNISQRLLKEAQVYARWGDYERADKLYEQAAKWQPEVKEIGVSMVGNKPVQVITYKDGRQQVTDYSPTPKTHWLDTGNAIQPIDEYTLSKRGQPFQKGMTPSDRIAAGNLDVSRRRLALDESSPQYMQTEGGLIALPKRPGAGPIVGQQVTGPDGQAIAPPLRPIPPSANTAIVTNMQNLQRAKSALELLNGEEVAGAKGDPKATGFKGYVPSTILNRVDPNGADTRAAIADLGSLVIHDRSGAAVTAAESPRLMPFIPLSTDDAATAKKKLERFVSIYQQETDALGEIYGKGQGYRPNPVLERGNSGNQPNTQPAKAAQPLPLPANPNASTLQAGRAYTLPNGKTATWDGAQFRVKK